MIQSASSLKKDALLSLQKELDSSAEIIQYKNKEDTMASKLKTLPFLKKLMSYDTTSSKSNLELIVWLKAYFESLSLNVRLTYNDEKTKANLFATIPSSTGETKEGGIVLSGHTDVVPIADQEWTYPPYDLTFDNGLFYGRGTCDMKGFVAGVTAFAEEMMKRKVKMPIHFAFSHDEETGCTGVPLLLDDMIANGYKPKMCIVGEPTMMKPVIGHKGNSGYRCKVIGKECHSSLLHLGLNAVEAACDIITYLRGMAKRIQEQGPHNPEYCPSYSTINIGVIHGGTVMNIVPNTCTFDFEIRNLPEDDVQKYIDELNAYIQNDLLPKMKQSAKRANVILEQQPSIPGLSTDEDADVVSFVKSVSGVNHSEKVSYGTEAGVFSRYGIETVIFGPGSIEQAHQENEFISLEQLELFEAFMGRFMDRVCVHESL